MLVDQKLEMYKIFFMFHVKVEIHQNVLKLVSLPYFQHDFIKNISHIIYFIDWLSLIFKMLVNICTVIIFCPVCDVTNFKINLTLLVKLLFYITKKSGQKYTYLKNGKSFQHEIQSIFHQFFHLKVLCYLQFLKKTKFFRVVLNHYW